MPSKNKSRKSKNKNKIIPLPIIFPLDKDIISTKPIPQERNNYLYTIVKECLKINLQKK
jgi:hypothetical protein